MKTHTLLRSRAVAAALPLLAAALLLAAGGGCGGGGSSSPPTPTPSPTPTPTPNPSLTGTIAFTSNKDTGGVVSQPYTMNASGNNITRLTNLYADETTYDWSPDGTKILFASNRNNSGGEKNNRDIYAITIAATGNTVARLTNDPSKNSVTAAWSPDGAKVVFSYGGEIALMNADGTGLAVLEGGKLTNSYGPTWSPDGAKIAFVADTPGADNSNGKHDQSLFVMNGDGAVDSRVQITTGGEYIHQVAWSPDGKSLVFDSSLDTGGVSSLRTQLYRMAPDGSGRARLTSNNAQDLCPSWSPDGTLVLFSSNRDHGAGGGGVFLYDLYAMNPNTGAITRITTSGPDAFVAPRGLKAP
jgi:TolB protein